ncbi:hypothetical protein AB0D45_03595 [Streptomyces sp. NPDC048352]|uniref:hypothetical protein n=1 Tax=Streptomyces sp. NPDC048352 TaxID=3154718 RepID=UPI003437B1CF
MPAHASRPTTALTATVLGICLVPGSGAPAGHASGSAAAPASAGRTPVAPLTVAQLKDAALVDADVPQVKTGMDMQGASQEPGKFPPTTRPAPTGVG